MNRNSLIGAGVAVGIAVAITIWFRTQGGEGPAPGIVVPQLSAVAEQGRIAFEATCAECHGVNGVGTENGPPLVHKIYEPNHHADLAFLRAVQFGVRAHHWPFGNMPPQPHVSTQQVADIVAYVRELQRANGIN